MQKIIRYHGSAISANLCWGFMAPITKIVLIAGIFSPFALVNLRVIGSMALFWILSLFIKTQKISLSDHVKIAFAALLSIVFNQGGFLFGVNLTSPANASIITTSMPLWAMILSAIILKEKLTVGKLTGLMLGAVGSVLLIMSSVGSNNDTIHSEYAIFGDLLILFAQFSYALYVVLYINFIRKYSVFTLMRWMFTYATLFITPFCFTDILAIDYSTVAISDYLGVLYIIVCGTFLAHLLIIFAQKGLSPTMTGMYNYIQPVVATSVTIVLGLDSLTALKLLSIVLIFSGVFIVTMQKQDNSKIKSLHELNKADKNKGLCLYDDSKVLDKE